VNEAVSLPAFARRTRRLTDGRLPRDGPPRAVTLSDGLISGGGTPEAVAEGGSRRLSR
jgi:hypothetical protein